VPRTNEHRRKRLAAPVSGFQLGWRRPEVRRTGFIRFVGGVILLLALAASAWLTFVPKAEEPGYAFVTAWGEEGSGPGQFRDAIGITVAEGEVFVADSRNGRIQVFDFEGEFKRQFGKPGDGPGELGRPMNLAIEGDELYVAEHWNDRIHIFGLDGTPRRIIGGSGAGPGQFSAPGGVAVAANGDLYIADFYNHRVQQLRPDGAFVRQWGATGENGLWAGEFNYPTDVAVSADGILYVADGYNDRIQAFGPEGRFLHKWGGPFALNISGPFNGWFATVTGIAVDKDGDVFVADFYNHRIQKFAPDGTFLVSFGDKGSAPGQFRYPVAVAAADDGSVYVADFGNSRIQRWISKK
jgi:DNA-binding beta-propeller fold protein YncE